MNIAALAEELTYLQANHTSMPITELQQRRGAALALATAITNTLAEADDFDREAFDRAYEIALAFDRVGY